MNRRLAIPLSLALLLGACGGTSADTNSSSSSGDEYPDLPEWEELEAEVPHDDSPELSPEDLQVLTSGQYALSTNLYEQWRQDAGFADENFALSAPNIQVAFGMLFDAVNEDYKDQVLTALAFDLGAPAFHEALNYQDAALRSLNQDATDDEDEVAVAPANGVWMQKTQSLPPSYLDALSQHYDVKVKLADFTVDSGNFERVRINEWVENRTRGLIADFIPEGMVNASTTQVLISALYLKAPWATSFDENATSDRPFTLSDGSEVSVPTMRANEMDVRLSHGSDYEVVAIPLRGDDLEMVVIMPHADFPTFETDLTPEFIAQALGEIQDGYVSASVMLPKFSFETSTGLETHLSALGLTDIWAPNWTATLLGAVTSVIHATTFAVDEKGVEASAATVIVVGVTGDDGGGPVDSVVIDKPFVFLLRDASTDTPLFLGRVLDPR